MERVTVILFLLFIIKTVSLQQTGSGTNGDLRLCVVEGRGSYKRIAKHCPIIDSEDSGVECVIGTDRLDCLRRISKGTADFAVLSPEDLVAAQWASVDVLVTNELRSRDRPFERSVVSVVNRKILSDGPTTLRAILRNRTLCHPGTDVDDLRPFSNTLSGYLEFLVLPQACDPELSLAENRIKALADFFGGSCKAGPWVVDKMRDAQLKRRYSSLCSACGSPTCSNQDRYWGDLGSLACLVEVGEVAWGELDDVKSYFGFKSTHGKTEYPSADNYALLCRDGSSQPIENATEACVWLHRPWPVIVARRKASVAVAKLASSLSNSTVTTDSHWRGALAALLEIRQAQGAALQPPRAADDYLARARGFREAYSQRGCNPPSNSLVTTDSHWRGAVAALLEIRQAQGAALQPPRAADDYLARARGFREAYSQRGCNPPSNSLVTTDSHWRGALAALLEIRQAQGAALQPPRAADDYLARARGFREAYSQRGCNPPRHITFCTTSILASNKCEWLSEAGAVYGVVPALQCISRNGTEACVDAVESGEAHVFQAESDWLLRGMRDHNLTALLHEATPIVEKTHTVVAYVRSDSNINQISDLRGKRATFPSYDGVSWHSVLRYLKSKHQLPCKDIKSYFSEICAPGFEKQNVTESRKMALTKNCYMEGGEVLSGEEQAIRALVEGKSDVAFVSMETYNKYAANILPYDWAQKNISLKPVCPEDNSQYCFISWSSIGHIFALNNLSPMRSQEIINVFTKLDQLFGKYHPFHTAMFSMYGPYNHQVDVLFHNSTKNLISSGMLYNHPYNRIPMNYERSLANSTDSCQNEDFINFGAKVQPTFLMLLVSLVAYFLS